MEVSFKTHLLSSGVINFVKSLEVKPVVLERNSFDSLASVVEDCEHLVILYQNLIT